VRLYLPRLIDEAAQADAPCNGAGRRGSVLITEDDPDVLAVGVETLRSLGYEVHTAANAFEALAILQGDTPIDVLFTDVVMPRGMNGVELAQEACRLRPGLPVLLSSGYSRPGLQADQEAVFIAKPYKIPELARRLETLIAGEPNSRRKPDQRTSRRGD
jgi:CheY-like chemotaxis protein